MSYVKPKSSMDIIGLYIKMIRDRFTPSNTTDKFPWAWSSDDKKTRIVIEAGGSEFEDSTDTRPGIFVDRGAIVFPKVVLGNRAAHDLATGVDLFYSTPSGQISIDCVSRSRGESSLLGDIVAHHILMSSDILIKHYNLRNITPVTLTPTQTWEKDNRCYITRVSSEFSYDLAWATTPYAHKISRIQALSDADKSKDLSLGDIVLTSLGLVGENN
tara:strand:+ start:4535 stop:5179 length:645 start_codon:yes stop_codon:yes gene_type:complete